MPSFKNIAAIMATAILALGAQAQTLYQIDPTTVPLSTRQVWCTSQLAACPLLCLQLEGTASTTTTNTCDPNTLDYACICGNGQAPNAALYSQTIPYFECTEYGNQCVAACGSHDNNCQTACRVDNLCGAQDPTKATNTTSTSSSASQTTSSPGSTDTSASTTGSSGSSASGTGTGTGTGTGGSSSASATTSGATSSQSSGTKSGAVSALDLGRSYSFALVLAGLFGAFALLM